MWNVGTNSWSGSGSTAGGVVMISSGGGYPEKIDGKVFRMEATLAGNNVPV